MSTITWYVNDPIRFVGVCIISTFRMLDKFEFTYPKFGKFIQDVSWTNTIDLIQYL